MCISFFILGIVLLLLQQSGIINLTALQDAPNYEDVGVVRDFRIEQLISDVFLFIVPVIVISFLVSRNRLHYLQVNKMGGTLLLLLGAVTIVVATPFISYVGELNAKIPLPNQLKNLEDMGDAIETALMAHHTITDLLLNLLVMALAAAICEEFFFRAGLQKIIIAMTKNVHIGIWITAIVFSAIHLQFSGFFQRMLLGGFLGYLFVWSGSIWVNILAHFIFNAFQIIVPYMQDAKATSGLVDGIFSATPPYGYIIISTVLVVFLMVLIYRQSVKSRVVEDSNNSEHFFPGNKVL